MNSTLQMPLGRIDEPPMMPIRRGSCNEGRRLIVADRGQARVCPVPRTYLKRSTVLRQLVLWHEDGCNPNFSTHQIHRHQPVN